MTSNVSQSFQWRGIRSGTCQFDGSLAWKIPTPTSSIRGATDAGAINRTGGMGERMRRYAQDTTVSVAKSRQEIDTILRSWGANGIRWTDNFETGEMRLEFAWRHEGTDTLIAARYALTLPDDDELKKRARHASTGYFLPSKFEKLKAGRGRPEMRQLALLIKAKLNAVETGIVSAEDEFLAHFIGNDDRTIGEAMIERLPELQSASATRLLGNGAPTP